MRTPLLLDVPKDSPSRKEKLEAFKALHQIETWNGGKTSDKDWLPWMAAWLPACRKIGYGGINEQSPLIEIVSKAGMLLDDAGLTAYGRTERDAMLKLCEQNGIPFPKAK